MDRPAPGFVRLVAPPESWEGPTFGGEQYDIRPDGTVDVPEEAARPLLEKGGFVLRIEGDDL